jgi:glutathione S-transferase
VLRTDAGETLTENTAVLQYIADRFPEAGLVPEGALPRARLRECLGFIGTELHKAVFVPLLDARAPEAVKSYAREKLALRMAVLERRRREFSSTRSRRRRVPGDGAQLTLATAVNLGGARGSGLPPAHAEAPEHRARVRRGARALPGGAGAREGALSARPGRGHAASWKMIPSV